MKTTVYALAIAACLAAGAAAAADITLYEHDNYGGRRIRASSSIADLDQSGFNDRASSATIHNGRWQLCADAYFRGHCVALGPGDYPSLGAMGLNDRVSSVRELWNNDGAGGGGPGGAEVVLYDAYDFNGSSIRVGALVANLDGSFNDRANSMIVQGGTWELCVDANFQGGCETFGPGRYSNLGGLSGRVSSLRPVRGGGGVAPGGGGWGSGNRAILFEGPNLSGRSFVIGEYLANLDGTGFNDRASSLRIERGYWIFCSDANFRGVCRTFAPGDYPNLPSGLEGRISSGRRISDDYPYRGNPNWGGPSR